ncbi:hypothetical protein C8J55DRAFT_495305 [Lentinula edodes]|uniref:Uncharacterized protein n=1 Tax=Lentinula lateritia TaxID=40482 RepID=A0A9W9B1P3_9AGAR|nr:hypothetical protein C8J55DRAFT_495305 [Lentinula edodes]
MHARYSCYSTVYTAVLIIEVSASPFRAVHGVSISLFFALRPYVSLCISWQRRRMSYICVWENRKQE